MNLRSHRHWIIGDVHGCHQPLVNLLAILPPDDHLVFCGDVINRGEAIPATMGLVWDLIQMGRATWLRGNHEQDLVHALENNGLDHHGLDNNGLDNNGVESLQDGLSQHATYGQLGDKSARQWLPRLQQLPLVYRADGWCATHAGFDCNGQPDLSIRDPFWEAYDGRFGLVVVGHTPRPQVERLGQIVLIDTGAVYGGSLSAYCPETDAVVQVQGAATGTRFPRPTDLNRRASALAGDAGSC